MSFLTTEEASIYYETHGDLSCSPVITLVNGHTRTTTDFRMMIKILLNANLSVITLDPRGSGQTTFSGDISLEQISSDIIKIWDHCKVKSSHLLGISMGGAICQIIAARHPKRVDKLILVSTTPSAEWIVPDPNAWSTDYDIIYSKFSRFFSEKFIQSNKLLLQAMTKQIQKTASDSDFVEKSENQRRAIDKLNIKDLISDIESGTLIIYGESDTAVLPAGSLFLAEKITNAKTLSFEGVGHLLLAEIPKKLYKAVITFCKE